MGATDKPRWAEYNKAEILSKDEYNELRKLAETHKIYLSGVKKLDGKFETVKELIETLLYLQSKFPNVVSGGKRLTLTMNPSLDVEDFAVTTKIKRTAKLR